MQFGIHMFIMVGGKLKNTLKVGTIKLYQKIKIMLLQLSQVLLWMRMVINNLLFKFLDGKNHEAIYHKFDADIFIPTPKEHHLSIDNNIFTYDKISLDLPNLKGHLVFKNQFPWSSSFFSPGIMGPYSFVPFMECYHGILSMNHTISGIINHNGIDISFDGGKGYMEKDWGHSFPKAYIWMQSNHFSKPNISIKSSIAIIPWLKSSFIGHIAGILIDDQLIEFTTYNGTKVNSCEITKKKCNNRDGKQVI